MGIVALCPVVGFIVVVGVVGVGLVLPLVDKLDVEERVDLLLSVEVSAWAEVGDIYFFGLWVVLDQMSGDTLSDAFVVNGVVMLLPERVVAFISDVASVVVVGLLVGCSVWVLVFSFGCTHRRKRPMGENSSFSAHLYYELQTIAKALQIR